MHKFILLLALFVVVAALPQNRGIVPIITSSSDVKWDGTYHFHYETGDGSYRAEEGNVVNRGTKDEYIAVKGSYRFILPNGRKVEVFYTADENGFVPRGISYN